MLLIVNTNPPSKAEISRALKMLRDEQTPGPDGIPPEALKADPITTTYMLHHLFQNGKMDNNNNNNNVYCLK